MKLVKRCWFFHCWKYPKCGKPVIGRYDTRQCTICDLAEQRVMVPSGYIWVVYNPNDYFNQRMEIEQTMFDRFWEAATALGVPDGTYTPDTLIQETYRAGMKVMFEICSHEQAHASQLGRAIWLNRILQSVQPDDKTRQIIDVA